MNKAILLLLFLVSSINVCYAQNSFIADLIADITDAKIADKNSAEKKYHSQSTLPDFDTYLYKAGKRGSDTVHTIGLLKADEIMGAVMACDGCSYYNSVVITSGNTSYPDLSQSMKRNGIIDYAHFTTADNHVLSVTDENSDGAIDVITYKMGQGMYGVLMVQKTLFNVTAFLVYNAFTLEYNGIITFKTEKDKKIFDKGYIRNGKQWSAYSLTGKKPAYLTSIAEKDILKRKLPNLDALNLKNDSLTTHRDTTRQREYELIELMKTNYAATLKNWLTDYRLVTKSGIIGTRLPKVRIIKN